MTQQNNKLSEILSRNRAEELDKDVWCHYVMPPYFERLDLIGARKPRIIVGGRGCGKTMLLRYLSHHSMFSINRKNIPDDALSHIGLYWRADTQFANAMTKRGLEDETWASAFNHYISIVLSMEFIDALRNIEKSTYSKLMSGDIDKLNFDRLSAFDASICGNVDNLYMALEKKLWEFESWVSNVRKVEEPIFLPGAKFLLGLVRELQHQLNVFNDAIFHIYIDEYENLCEYQQKIINTWLKHSENPVIYHLAVKRNGFETRKTVGDELLSDVHDMRHYDLEDHMSESDFKVFAAEILFSEMLEVNSDYDFPVVIEDLHDIEKIRSRKNPDYIKIVTDTARNLLPSKSPKELASMVIDDPSLKGKIEKKVSEAIRREGATYEVGEFIVEDHPEVSVVVPALLARKNISTSIIASEINKLKSHKDNKFTGKTNWVHNNLVGALLQIYAPHSKPCPVYAGFDAFCLLAKGNIRHFLELCYKSISRTIDEFGEPTFPIDIYKQAEAARQASTAFLGEIRSFGPQGEKLHSFILRIGSLFSASHRRPTQSEPEVTHFSISSGRQELSDSENKLLREAVKWSVLFEAKETKKKDVTRTTVLEYVLNPIYAPYFQISFRKKRKLELSTDEVKTLLTGSLDDYTRLLREYERKWQINEEMSTLSLF